MHKIFNTVSFHQELNLSIKTATQNRISFEKSFYEIPLVFFDPMVLERRNYVEFTIL